MVVKSAPMPTVENNTTSHCNPTCLITYNRDSWVILNQPISEYSQSEALLLCEESEGVWVSWVPEYGEVVLDKSQFYC